MLSIIAEFAADLARMRTREGMAAVPTVRGRPRGKEPKLKPAQEKHLVELWKEGTHTTSELAELFVGRSTVYRAVHREEAKTEIAQYR